MANFSDQKFCKSILDLAQAYGPYAFWTDNLVLGVNPDATWRALMVVAALKDKLNAESVLMLLKSPDSRVRAWACTTLAELEYQKATGEIRKLTLDPSSRVRVHARKAIRKMSGTQSMRPRFHMRGPQKERLILISEDDKNWQLHLNLTLTKMGFLVQIASSEQDTVDLALKLRPWMIITDNQKVSLSGEIDNLSGLNMTWDLCRNQALRDTIFFMMTSDLIETIFLWSGGDEYFTKPPGIEFEQTVRGYLQGE